MAQGNRWSDISRQLPDRTETNVKNHVRFGLELELCVSCQRGRVAVVAYQTNYGHL
jgi:hypothetical protein